MGYSSQHHSLKFSARVTEVRQAVTEDILRGERDWLLARVNKSWREAEESSHLVFSTNTAIEILASIFCLQFLIFFLSLFFETFV